MRKEDRISIVVLLDELGIPYEENPDIDWDMGIYNIKFFERRAEPQVGALIVGRLSEVLSAQDRGQDNIYICPRDCFSGEDEDTRNIVVLKTNYSVEHLFNMMLDIVFRIRGWRSDMQECVLKNQGIQKLLDLSESIIGNHIDVMDATYKLLAYTKNIPINNDVTNTLIETGYHPNETVSRFRELRRIEEFEKNDDLIISSDKEMCEYDTVKRVFHLNGNVHLFVVMHCNNRVVTEGLLVLFRYLLQNIRRYSDSNMINPETFAESKNLIREILENKITSIDEAINRSSYAAMPFHKQYVMFMISFQDVFNVPMENLVIQLSKYILNSYVLSFNRSILVLRHLNEGDKIEDLKERIVEVAQTRMLDIPCTIGMSNVFENLWQVRPAREQCGYAVEYGWHKVRNVPQSEREPVNLACFEDSFLTLIVAKSFNQSPESLGNSFMISALDRIERYDEKHSTKLMQTLEAYLFSGKKATDVCKDLHMHRNTVLYHIERIETIIGESLNDQDVTIKLQLGLLMRNSNMHQMLTSHNVGEH